jgi:hypothetical protein
MTYTERHLREAEQIIRQIDASSIERMVDVLASVRRRGHPALKRAPTKWESTR